MATINIEGETATVDDGGAIIHACEALGVPFGCQSGVCGTCTVRVESGADNLLPMNELEEAMDLEPNERLACQACIREGEVELSW